MGTSDSSSGRGPGRPAGTTRGDTRENLLSVAREMLCAEGSPDVTIRQIAAQAKVNPALLHYYFGTKAGLHTAVLEQIAGDFRANIEALPTDGNARVRLERTVRACADSLIEFPFVIRMLAQDLLNEGGSTDGPPNPIAAVFVEVLGALVREGISTGELRNVDPDLTVGAIAANILTMALAGPVLRGTAAARALDRDLLAKAVPEILLIGVATKP